MRDVDQVRTWLTDNALPLSRVEPGGASDEYEDLRPWASTLADARVIGLGEATHGTREFFTRTCEVFRTSGSGTGCARVGRCATSAA
jgi:erythromycin esterase-like protein